VNAGAAAAAALLLALPASAQSPRLLIGRSVEGRRIEAVELGDPDSSTKLLVVGCIHGNECAGLAIVHALERLPMPAGLDLWVIENLNPDGFRTGTRQNAHGVDLNRNFPWAWRPLGGVYDSGPRPLSEPESRIAYRLILRVRPRISIWFHQHERLVDESGGDIGVERRFSELVGLPLQRLPREPGSAVGWENHRLPGTTAFVVELPAGSLSTTAADRYARAVLALARAKAGRVRRPA
jgi:murein peptide amidase A